MVIPWFCNVRRWRRPPPRRSDLLVAECLEQLHSLLMLLQMPGEEDGPQGSKHLHELRGLLCDVHHAVEATIKAGINDDPEACVYGSAADCGFLSSLAGTDLALGEMRPCRCSDAVLQEKSTICCAAPGARCSALRLRRRARPRRPRLLPAWPADAAAAGGRRSPPAPPASCWPGSPIPTCLRCPGGTLVPAPPSSKTPPGGLVVETTSSRSPGRASSSPTTLASERDRAEAPRTRKDFCGEGWQIAAAEDYRDVDDPVSVSSIRMLCRLSAPGLREVPWQPCAEDQEERPTERAQKVAMLRKGLMKISDNSRLLYWAPVLPAGSIAADGAQQRNPSDDVAQQQVNSSGTFRELFRTCGTDDMLFAHSQQIPFSGRCRSESAPLAPLEAQRAPEAPRRPAACVGGADDDVEADCEHYVVLQQKGRSVWVPRVSLDIKEGLDSSGGDGGGGDGRGGWPRLMI